MAFSVYRWFSRRSDCLDGGSSYHELATETPSFLLSIFLVSCICHGLNTYGKALLSWDYDMVAKLTTLKARGEIEGDCTIHGGAVLLSHAVATSTHSGGSSTRMIRSF